MAQYSASSFQNNSDGTISINELCFFDEYNKADGRKKVCQEVNRFLRKQLIGEIRIINVDTDTIVSIISVS